MPRKGALGGRYLVQRTLNPSSHKLLRDVELKRPENSQILEYFKSDEFWQASQAHWVFRFSSVHRGPVSNTPVGPTKDADNSSSACHLRLTKLFQGCSVVL
ncbi:hypothetical protein F5Y18DRAFT_392807 [Xylariaceae sp. FL1019]|nr:hypothetical protein F5Y18DRAFT_392807 [Xylariaceae sp. FL1019]